MVSVAALFLMVLGFAVVAYPLVRPAARLMTGARQDDDVDELTRERDAAYGAIKELEFEYQLGNLSPEDFQGLREQYAERAARALSRLDAAEERARSAEAERAETAAAAAVAEIPVLPPGTCPLCAQLVDEDDRFCGECGAMLSRFCPVCGAQREPTDTTCARCGNALKAET